MKLCDYCGKPLPGTVHVNTKMHSDCRAQYNRTYMRDRYRANKKDRSREVVCRGCDVRFRTIYPRQLYCTAECRDRSYGVPPLREFVCAECGIEFKSRRPTARVCPACLPHDKPEAPDTTITEPGPCRTCRTHETDARGIMCCPLMGGKPCADLNPRHDCAVRVPESAEKVAVDRTDVLVRRAARLEARTRDAIAEVEKMPHRAKRKVG